MESQNIRRQHRKGKREMAKIVDITDKLSFDENPVLLVKGEKIEVQADAENMLKIMGLFRNGKSETEASAEAANLIFNERDRKKIAKMKIPIKDYMILIQEAMNLAMGEDDASGEQ